MFWTLLAWIALLLLALLIVLLGYALLVRVRLQVALGLHSASGESLPERIRFSAGPLFLAEGLIGATPPTGRHGSAAPSESLWLHWRMLFWTGTWKPLEEPFPERWKKRLGGKAEADAPEEERKQPASQKKKRKSGQRWTPSSARVMVLIQEAFGAFHVARFHANIDTGDWTLNAKAYPVASWVQSQGHSLGINFRGHNEVELDAWLRAGHLLWALLRGWAKRPPRWQGMPALAATLGRRVGLLMRPSASHWKGQGFGAVQS